MLPPVNVYEYIMKLIHINELLLPLVPFNGHGRFKAPTVLKNYKKSVTRTGVPIFFPAFLGYYSSCEK